MELFKVIISVVVGSLVPGTFVSAYFPTEEVPRDTLQETKISSPIDIRPDQV